VIAAVIIGEHVDHGWPGRMLGTVLGALHECRPSAPGSPARLAQPTLSDLFVGVFVIVAVGTDLLRQLPPEVGPMTSTASARKNDRRPRRRRTAPPTLPDRCAGRLRGCELTRRELLLVILLVVVLVWMTSLGLWRLPDRPYDPDYLAAALVDAVPLAMLEAGRAAGDRCRAGAASTCHRARSSRSRHGVRHRLRHVGLAAAAAILLAVLVGGLLGAVNGRAVAWLGFPR